jgi:hypothetical protein
MGEYSVDYSVCQQRFYLPLIPFSVCVHFCELRYWFCSFVSQFVCTCKNISHSSNNKYTFSGGRAVIASETRVLAFRLQLRYLFVTYFVFFVSTMNCFWTCYWVMFSGMYVSNNSSVVTACYSRSRDLSLTPLWKPRSLILTHKLHTNKCTIFSLFIL